MKVVSSGIVDGKFDLKYGKHGTQFDEKGMCTYSIPLEILDAPKGTVTFAIVMEDKDAIPVSGFSWIHWTVANLTRNYLLENESINAKDFIQGTTSYSSRLSEHTRLEASFYGGMAPPNCPHIYEVHVYALDTELDLETGFYMNELYKAMDGHILESVTIKGEYPNKI